jgi:ABC-type amino acid transport substrate-binding protein
MKRVLLAVAALVALGLAAGCGGSAKAAAPTRLIGLFKLTPGHCTTAQAKPTGSYLIAISAAENHAVTNKQGGCADPAYTPLTPGTDGGLITGGFQTEPKPAFDAERNATATRIVKPVAFGRFRFGMSTNPRDEQDAPGGEPAFPAPVALDTDGALAIDLRSLVLTYAGRSHSTCKQSYGLGCWELGSKSASGTYDAATHQFVIDWFSGESFVPNGDSIEVHLEGTFVPGSGT